MRKDRFTDEALRNARALAELKAQDSESFSEAYDFARCQRPDGSFYGTSGQCRKGKEAGDKPAEAPKTRSQVSMVTPQATTQADVDRLRKYRDEQQARVKTIGEAMTKNPDARKDPKVMKSLELAIRNVEVSNAQLSKAMDEVGKQGLKSGDRGAAEPKPKKMKTDFRKDVEAGAAKRKARDEKIVARQNRDRELLTSIRGKVAEQSAKKKEVAALERQAKEAARAVKREASKENKEQLKRINAALRIQDRALTKMEREIDKMARERGRIAQQAERERMTPAQRAEAARVRKIIKERG